MYNIEFYETTDGISEIRDFLEMLRFQAPTSKDARIQYKQIARYIELLAENGTYVLLHHFRKKTQKTPAREIKKAQAEMHDYINQKRSNNR